MTPSHGGHPATKQKIIANILVFFSFDWRFFLAILYEGRTQFLHFCPAHIVEKKNSSRGKFISVIRIALNSINQLSMIEFHSLVKKTIEISTTKDSFEVAKNYITHYHRDPTWSVGDSLWWKIHFFTIIRFANNRGSHYRIFIRESL